MLGFRGLLILLDWHAGLRDTTYARLAVRDPQESWQLDRPLLQRDAAPRDMWMRRHAEIECVHWERRSSESFGSFTISRRSMRWTRALRELRVPLRALSVFHGEAGMRERGFPNWAISDIGSIDLCRRSSAGPGSTAQEPMARLSIIRRA